MPATTATVGGQAGSRRNAPGTRRSILAAARDLFASQGYAGTSIADIAGRLGTSKAALYYHFQSKAEILQALLDEPVTAWARLADSATAGQRSAEDLLSAVIDTTAGLHTVAEVIGNDPSAQAAVADLLPRSREVNQAITATLARAAPRSRKHRTGACRLRSSQERHPGPAVSNPRPPDPRGQGRASSRRHPRLGTAAARPGTLPGDLTESCVRPDRLTMNSPTSPQPTRRSRA